MQYKHAVIILGQKDEIIRGTPFYQTKICGEKLILRSLFSLQKTGIDNILIISDNTTVKILQLIKNDIRVKANIKNINISTEKISKILKENIKSPFIAIMGDIIFNYQNLEYTLNSDRNKINTNKITALSNEGIICIPDLSLIDSQVSYTFENFISRLCKAKDTKLLDKNEIFLEKISNHISIKSAEKKLLMSLKSPSYGFIEKHFDRKVSIIFSKYFVKTKITPNQITILSTLIGLSSVPFFINGTKEYSVTGSLLFILSTIIDCSDGEVARLRFMESKFGSLLDIICDNLVQIPLFFSIAYGLFKFSNSPYILSIGFFAVFGSTLSFILILLNMVKKDKLTNKLYEGALSPIEKREYDLGKKIDSFINRDFAYLILVCAYFGMLNWFLYATAIGSNILWIIIIIKKGKALIYEKV